MQICCQNAGFDILEDTLNDVILCGKMTDLSSAIQQTKDIEPMLA